MPVFSCFLRLRVIRHIQSTINCPSVVWSARGILDNPFPLQRLASIPVAKLDIFLHQSIARPYMKPCRPQQLGWGRQPPVHPSSSGESNANTGWQIKRMASPLPGRALNQTDGRPGLRERRGRRAMGGRRV